MSWFFKMQILTDEHARSRAYLLERLKGSAAKSLFIAIAALLGGYGFSVKPPGERILMGLALAAAIFAIDGGLEYYIWSARVRKWRTSGDRAAASSSDDEETST